MKYTEEEIIKEASKRGYRTGTLVDYEGLLAGTDTLGSGEFKLIDNDRGCRLIKYEEPLRSGQNPHDRRFDTVWSRREGWTKIADKAHGFAL